MFNKFSLLFFVFLCATNFRAQDLNPKYANEYLNMGVGADALGMGSAVVGQTSGVLAGVWNPAGLSQQVQQTEIAGMHAAYFGGIAAQDYIGVSRKLNGNNVVSLNMLRLGIDNIYNTTQLIDNNGNIDYTQLQQCSERCLCVGIALGIRQIGIGEQDLSATQTKTRKGAFIHLY